MKRTISQTEIEDLSPIEHDPKKVKPSTRKLKQEEILIILCNYSVRRIKNFFEKETEEKYKNLEKNCINCLSFLKEKSKDETFSFEWTSLDGTKKKINSVNMLNSFFYSSMACIMNQSVKKSNLWFKKNLESRVRIEIGFGKITYEWDLLKQDFKITCDESELFDCLDEMIQLQDGTMYLTFYNMDKYEDDLITESKSLFQPIVSTNSYLQLFLSGSSIECDILVIENGKTLQQKLEDKQCYEWIKKWRSPDSKEYEAFSKLLKEAHKICCDGDDKWWDEKTNLINDLIHYNDFFDKNAFQEGDESFKELILFFEHSFFQNSRLVFESIYFDELYNAIDISDSFGSMCFSDQCPMNVFIGFFSGLVIENVKPKSEHDSDDDKTTISECEWDHHFLETISIMSKTFGDRNVGTVHIYDCLNKGFALVLNDNEKIKKLVDQLKRKVGFLKDNESDFCLNFGFKYSSISEQLESDDLYIFNNPTIFNHYIHVEPKE